MRNLITGVLTLTAMGFTFAQMNIDVSTQNGNLNAATVTQTGMLNSNSLLQDGNRNVATIDQTGIQKL